MMVVTIGRCFYHWNIQYLWLNWKQKPNERHRCAIVIAKLEHSANGTICIACLSVGKSTFIDSHTLKNASVLIYMLISYCVCINSAELLVRREYSLVRLKVDLSFWSVLFYACIKMACNQSFVEHKQNELLVCSCVRMADDCFWSTKNETKTENCYEFLCLCFVL